jgi:hypothetical protein
MCVSYVVAANSLRPRHSDASQTGTGGFRATRLHVYEAARHRDGTNELINPTGLLQGFRNALRPVVLDILRKRGQDRHGRSRPASLSVAPAPREEFGAGIFSPVSEKNVLGQSSILTLDGGMTAQ